MYSPSDNIEIIIDCQTYEIIKEVFKSLLQRYQEGLEKSVKGNEFFF